MNRKANIPWVLDVCETSTEIALATALSMHPGLISVKDLSSWSKLSRSTVLRTLRAFEARDIVSIQKQPGGASTYMLHLPGRGYRRAVA